MATIIAQTAFQNYQSGQYEAAVEGYKRAVKTAPGFAPVYRNWAIMEAYEDHLADAEQLMKKAAELDPKDPQIFLIWGNIYRKKSKYSEAHKKYTIANNLAPEDPIILNALGQAKGRLGDYEEANNLLEKALKSNFNSLKHELICKTSLAENLIGWGDFLCKDRNFTEAEIKYNLAADICYSMIDKNTRDIKLFTALNKANLRKAHLYLSIQQDSKALRVLNSVAHSNPANFRQYQLKIEALLLLGEYYKRVHNKIELFNIITKLNQFKGSDILKQSPGFIKRISTLNQNFNEL